MCQDMYAPMQLLRLVDHKTPDMDKLFHFVLQKYRMLPKWIKYAWYHSKNLLTPGVKKIFEDTKDATSMVIDTGD